MKKLFLLMMAIFITFGSVFAQSDAKDIVKDRKITEKYSEKELNEKASKAAMKESKRLKKEGWLVSPGALPLEKMLDRSYKMQFEYTADGMPRYLMAEAQSIAESYDGAKLQAMELSKQNLAGQICSEINALVENTVANNQLANEQAATITQTVLASKNLISQRIGRVVPVVECYRVKNNKNKEVLVRLAYDVNKAYDVAKQVVREELQKKGDDLHKQLDKALGF